MRSTQQILYERFFCAILDNKPDDIRSCVSRGFIAQIPGGHIVNIDGFVAEVAMWHRLFSTFGSDPRTSVAIVEEGNQIVRRYHRLLTVTFKRKVRRRYVRIVEVITFDDDTKITDFRVLWNGYGNVASRFANDGPAPPGRGPRIG